MKGLLMHTGNKWYYIVNSITLYRLIAAPVLVILIVTRQTELFKWLLSLSFFTDAIDGYIARRHKVVSIAGSRLDSVADDLTIVAAIVALLVFKIDFIRQELIPIGMLLLLYVSQLLYALIRYGRISSFHTYGAKVAAVLQAVFLLLIFFDSKLGTPAFYFAAAVTALELIEEIILVALLPQWRTDVKGLYWLLRNKSQ